METTDVSRATAEDLPSIGTLHSRAFTSEWHRKVFPRSISPWWEDLYARSLADPACHVLRVTVSADSRTPDMSSSPVVGLISLRRFDADDRGARPWTELRPPPSVDGATYDAMVDSMVRYRERFMLGRRHFCVDHFGVDEEYQGRGIGGRLLARACEIADEEELDVFVEANEFAESFYNRFGFETMEKEVMPGGLTEYFLVRRFKSR